MDLNQRQYVFILGSARLDGNTEHLVRLASKTLPETAGRQWLRLSEHPLPPFEDIRHHETRKYEINSGHEKVLLDATLSATDLVIASPVYWYSLSASTKLYLDYWSAWMRLPDIEFKKRMAAKTLWAVSALSDGESTAGAQPLIETLRLTAEYMSMKWGGVLLGYGNRPGDVLNDPGSLDRAAHFFAGSSSADVP